MQANRLPRKLTSRVLPTFVLSSISLAAVLWSADVRADQPQCDTSGSGPYCTYAGTVKKAYINTNGLILLYFDTTLNLADPESVGITGVTKDMAAAVQLSATQSPSLPDDFARAVYATLLAAQARGASVTATLRGVTSGGYLQIEKIWVHE